MSGSTATAQDEPIPPHRAALNAFDKNTGELRWRTAVGGKSGILRVLDTENGVVLAHQWPCIGSFRRSSLVGFDATTGRELWRTRFDGASTSLYFPGAGSSIPPRGQGTELERIDLKTGKPEWRTEFGGFEWVVDDNDDVVLLRKGDAGAGYFDQLRALDPKTGKIRWEFPPSSEGLILASATMGGDTVLVTTAPVGLSDWTLPGDVRALDTATGHERWRASDTPLANSLMFGTTIITASEPDRELRPPSRFDEPPPSKFGVTGYDAYTGRELWNVPIEANVLEGGADVILVQTWVGGASMYSAIDARTGTVRWTAPIGTDPVAATKQLIVTFGGGGGTNPSGLTAIDSHAGTTRWSRSSNFLNSVVIGRFVYAGEGCAASEG